MIVEVPREQPVKIKGIGDRPMTPEQALARYRPLVEQAARQSDNNPEVTAPPLLYIAEANGLFPVYLTNPNFAPSDQLSTAAYGVSHGVLPSAVWAVFLSEGFTAASPRKEDLDNLARHELRDRFMIGMSGVGEGVSANMAHRDGRLWVAHQIYTRAPAFRALKWEPMRSLENKTVGGRVAKLMQVIVGRATWESTGEVVE